MVLVKMILVIMALVKMVLVKMVLVKLNKADWKYEWLHEYGQKSRGEG